MTMRGQTSRRHNLLRFAVSALTLWGSFLWSTVTPMSPGDLARIAYAEDEPANEPEEASTPGADVSSDATKYTVSPGDTLYSIARRSGVPVSNLAAANGLPNPDALAAGQVLTVPPASEGRPVELTAAQVARPAAPPARAPTPSIEAARAAAAITSQQMAAAPQPQTAAPAQAPKTASASGRLPGQDGGLIWPITGAISQGFAPSHRAVDIASRSGTPIKAAAAGKVVRADKSDGAYGWCIVIDHGGNAATVYAHLSSFNVRPGDVVKQGQVVGGVGSTGLSTGPHLHFELRANGVPIDPTPYLPVAGR